MKRLAGLSLPILLLCCFAGMFVGSSSYTVYYAEGTSYLSDDPRACVNCHIMRDHYDGWQKASHHAMATCNDCHLPQDFFSRYVAKARNGFWHSKGFTLQDFHEPIRIRSENSQIMQDNCVRCHKEMVSEIAGHKDEHGNLNCVGCHGSVGHGPTR